MMTRPTHLLWIGVIAAGGLACLAGAEPAPGRGPRSPMMGGPNRGGPGGPPNMEMNGALIGRILQHPELAERLGLTDEQTATLRDGMYELRKVRVRKQADMELAAIEQARLLTSDDVDEDALMEAVEKTGRIRTELAKLEMKSLLLLRETLDDEQHDKVRRFMQRQRRGPEDARGPQVRERREREGEGREVGPRAEDGRRHKNRPDGDERAPEPRE